MMIKRKNGKWKVEVESCMFGLSICPLATSIFGLYKCLLLYGRRKLCVWPQYLPPRDLDYRPQYLPPLNLDFQARG